MESVHPVRGYHMLILIDNTEKFIQSCMKRHPKYKFGQLRTPLTNKPLMKGVPWALDNGCYTRFNEPAWKKLVEEVNDDCLWVAMPDIVGDARRTLELWKHFQNGSIPCALVAQNGIDKLTIPWEQLEAVFIGGDDEFKFSKEAEAIARCARILGKYVHYGRINGKHRLNRVVELADSIDGSGISRFDECLDNMLRENNHPEFSEFIVKKNPLFNDIQG